MKLGPSFTDLDSLDVSCVDDDEMETKDNMSKDDDDNNATEAGNPSFHPLQRNERKETESKRRYNTRESTRNLLSEADDDDNDSEHSVVVRQPSVLIRRQPSSSGMVVFPYDPESKETLERLSVEHRSHSQLKRLINKELTKITRDADIRVQSLNGGLSYPAFLKGEQPAVVYLKLTNVLSNIDQLKLMKANQIKKKKKERKKNVKDQYYYTIQGRQFA